MPEPRQWWPSVAKPIIHARSSAKRFGGKPEDYFPIHDFLDSSKAAFPDNRHRALTHNSWFLFVLEKVHMPEHKWLGPILTNSDGRQVSVREIGEQHILEDFRMEFIPTPADYLQEMEIKPWMNNGMGGSVPPSHERIARRKRTTSEKAAERVD
jgi:hypothetical protein